MAEDGSQDGSSDPMVITHSSSITEMYMEEKLV